jgi:hypothetical protein
MTDVIRPFHSKSSSTGSRFAAHCAVLHCSDTICGLYGSQRSRSWEFANSAGRRAVFPAKRTFLKKTSTERLGRFFPQLSVLFSRELNSVELTSPKSCRSDRACPARARASLRTALHRSGDRCHTSCPCHLSARTCRPALRLFPRMSGHHSHR